jgi:hypothetical protein
MKRLRLHGCVALVAAATLSSCGGDDDADGGATRQGASGGPTCSNLEDRADALLEAAQECEQDADCTLVELGAECVPSLLCSVPLSVDADVERVRREARALGQEAVACGGACAFANCAPPAMIEVHCDPIEQRCEHGLAAGGQDGGPR